MGSKHQEHDFLYMVVIASVLVCIGVAHHFVSHTSLLWHNFFQWLYYVPVVVASLRFGLRGGLIAAGLASLGYIPHLLKAPHGYPDDYVVVQFAAVLIMLAVGAITGLLADREHKRHRELQLATEQLRRAHRDLQTSFDQLKRADRLSAVGQLAAGLAHEIRNPLGSIRGAVDIMDQPETGPEAQEEFRGIIKRETRRLEQLLTNLLDFARPQSPEFEKVNIDEQLGAVIKLVSKTADRNGSRIRKDIAENLPRLVCDPDQLRQVVLNLALNALQAMPEGGEVVIASRQRNDHLVIDVIDQGLGIEGDFDRVFDPFFTTKENGTGLGLAVTRKIVEQHNGVIQVKRNRDRGMTFSLIFPLCDEASPHNGPDPRPGGLVPVSGPTGSS